MDQTERLLGYIKETDPKENQEPSLCIILGAGASLSSNIPLASTLIGDVKREYAHRLSDLPPELQNDYPSVMSRLDPAGVKKILTPHIENATVSWGYIALAQLIKNGKIKRVLTFNFDFALQKALSLLDVHIPIYDFAVAPASNSSRIVSPSLVHLHGQGHGLTLINSKEETEEHSQKLEPILKETLQNHMTLIAGYSGLADKAGKIISDSYDSEHTLLWTEYNDEPNTLQEQVISTGSAEFFGGMDFDETMISIARSYDIWPPKILANPIEQMIESLEKVAKYPTKKLELDLFLYIREHLIMASENWVGQHQIKIRAIEDIAQRKFSDARLKELEKLAAVHETEAPFATAYIMTWIAFEVDSFIPTDSTSTSFAQANHLFSLYDRALLIEPNNAEIYASYIGLCLIGAYQASDFKEKRAFQDVAKSNVHKFRSKGFGNLLEVAQYFFMQADHTNAILELEALEKNGGLSSGELQHFLFTPLHDNPRFQDLLEKIKEAEAKQP